MNFSHVLIPFIVLVIGLSLATIGIYIFYPLLHAWQRIHQSVVSFIMMFHFFANKLKGLIKRKRPLITIIQGLVSRFVVSKRYESENPMRICSWCNMFMNQIGSWICQMLCTAYVHCASLSRVLFPLVLCSLPDQRWEFIKENKKVKQKENKLPTKKKKKEKR